MGCHFFTWYEEETVHRGWEAGAILRRQGCRDSPRMGIQFFERQAHHSNPLTVAREAQDRIDYGPKPEDKYGKKKSPSSACRNGTNDAFDPEIECPAWYPWNTEKEWAIKMHWKGFGVMPGDDDLADELPRQPVDSETGSERDRATPEHESMYGSDDGYERSCHDRDYYDEQSEDTYFQSYDAEDGSSYRSSSGPSDVYEDTNYRVEDADHKASYPESPSCYYESESANYEICEVEHEPEYGSPCGVPACDEADYQVTVDDHEPSYPGSPSRSYRSENTNSEAYGYDDEPIRSNLPYCDETYYQAPEVDDEPVNCGSPCASPVYNDTDYHAPEGDSEATYCGSPCPSNGGETPTTWVMFMMMYVMISTVVSTMVGIMKVTRVGMRVTVMTSTIKILND
ncbi:hypothetical protein M011DRAFT_509924 [Sporormia fimetaria CBS 119925]|uniref:Uncharacterized protein n=1 Tax=Sporormia fimetaria CBS 119925 TaxID=1340428 RepID=A0A6A6VKK2_9PLEO|nr:hypothetical protein M011DRAFT_509924 [Sporormia fimetaria CBS 119925]